MTENNTPQEILEKIKSSENILIKLHDSPDGDSLGCSVAMKYFLERDFDKKVTLISGDDVVKEFHALPFIKEVDFSKSLGDLNLNDFDLILFLDHGTLKYKKGGEEIVLPEGKVVNIDHHNTNAYYGDLNYIDSSRPSCCSILIDLFKAWEVEFDKELANRLLLGTYTDTLGFTTKKEAIVDGAFLIEQGADMSVIEIIKFNQPLDRKKYFARLIENFQVVEIDGHKVGFSSLTKKDLEDLELNLSDIRGGPNYLQEIEGIDILFTLAEKGDLIKGSFRSRRFDTSLIAKELGGGGHKLASAFYLKDLSFEEAQEKVLEAVKKIGFHE